ncbi:MAG: ATP-dependent sacrificial sulfur transferase LarE [Acidimicrobiales bacterium]
MGARFPGRASEDRAGHGFATVFALLRPIPYGSQAMRLHPGAPDPQTSAFRASEDLVPGDLASGHSAPDSLDPAQAAALARLRDGLRRLGRVLVAFSGGADSAFLAWVARDELGPDRVLAVTATSPSLAARDLDHCQNLARAWGLSWMVAETAEMADPAYVANGVDRCARCKEALMDALDPMATEDGSVVILGVNLDDLGDHRPGQQAAGARGAVFPLVEAGFTKAAVRQTSRHLGLSTWDRPAAACLSSRLPTGTPVTLGTLGRVEAAEAGLWGLGFRQVRVRHYGDLARIEVDTDALDDVLRRRCDVIAAVKEAGYRFVTLDLEGFRSGSLNPPPGRASVYPGAQPPNPTDAGGGPGSDPTDPTATSGPRQRRHP